MENLKSDYFWLKWSIKSGSPDRRMRSHAGVLQWDRLLEHTLHAPQPYISILFPCKYQMYSQPLLSTSGWLPGRSIFWTIVIKMVLTVNTTVFPYLVPKQVGTGQTELCAKGCVWSMDLPRQAQKYAITKSTMYVRKTVITFPQIWEIVF